MFLHRWKQEPTISTIAPTHEIEATFDCKCPEWKVLCAANRAKQLLGIDHEDGYAMVNQFKQEMETIDRNNIVLVDTEILPSDGGERFKRMFVCYERASYAFKVHCQRLLAVDGWKMNNPYNSVMLVAAALDGNNGILPVAFCEVEVEDMDSWVYFLKNINNALRLESGTGLCILADGDNDVEYAVEEYLAHATYRQCCHRIFTEMVNRFPKAAVHHLFWAACRSTSASAFFKYMELICVQSKECHDWLEKSNWKRWALFCVPEWVKCTCITLTITEKLRNYCQPYLEMNIARKFEAIARLTSELFEQRRMVVWNWNREKVPPKVRDVINDRCIDGKRLSVVQDHGTLLKVTDSLSSSYDLNMEAMTCTCGLWQISGIPYPHACIGIHYINGNVEDYVDELLSVQNFLSTYAPGMMQLPKENAWKWHSGHNLHPPMTVALQPLTLQPPNDITSNKDLQHTLHHYYSTTDNLQVNVFLTLIVCCFP